jgi:hypothetical protein
MINREEILKAIRSKKSNQSVADKLGISVEEYQNLKREIQNAEQEINGAEELLRQHDLNTNEVTVISGWVRNDDMSIQFKAKNEEISYKDSFVEFLKTFTPKETVLTHPAKDLHKSNVCLVLNIQDAHWNQYDINGNNDIHRRFSKVEDKIKNILLKSSYIHNIEKIIYVLGSDSFNSEWTGFTTKGTPQSNILDYHKSFKAICQHEVSTIERLLSFSQIVEIVYCPGNHDQFVGWHMLTWLEAYFKNELRLIFDTSEKNTKVKSYSDSLMLFNHGDAMKQDQLARIFPIYCKDKWSSSNFYYCFSGDKHTNLSKDYNGIKCYRIPCLSTSMSSWEDKNGYTTSKAELTAFLIEENEGITTIMSQCLD